MLTFAQKAKPKQPPTSVSHRNLAGRDNTKQNPQRSPQVCEQESVRHGATSNKAVHRGFDFSRIPIFPAQPAVAGRAAGACNSRLPKAAELLGAPEPDADHRNSQSPGPGPGSGAGSTTTAASGSAAPSANLSVTSAGYADSASASNKSVTFDATWSGGVQEDYILVQWLKGYMKKPDGTPYKVTMYGSSVDFNFTDFQIDSVDADPAYWSAGGTRWNYTVGSGNSFSATDAPGPMSDSDGAGAKAHVDFKIAVYKSADVPATTTGSIAAAPLSSWHTWSYHVNVLGGGKFSHG